MSTELAPTKETPKQALTVAEIAAQPGSLKSILNSQAGQAQIAAALPRHLTPERFARVAITAMTKNPKLLECTRESFFQCILDVAQMGLEPDGRRAHLVPYWNSKDRKMICTLIPDYKGITELVMRSGLVSSLHADKVCENDLFRANKGKIETHEVNYRQDRGKAYAYYALITFKDGTEKAEVMTLAEVEAIRARSKSGSSGPWVTDFDEMAKKTVFKRASKWLSLSPEIRNAIEYGEDELLAANTVRQATGGRGFAAEFGDKQPPAIEVPAEPAKIEDQDPPQNGGDYNEDPNAFAE